MHRAGERSPAWWDRRSWAEAPRVSFLHRRSAAPRTARRNFLADPDQLGSDPTPLASLPSLLLLASLPQLHFHDPGPRHRGLVEALRIRLRNQLVESRALEKAGTIIDRIIRVRSSLPAETAAGWMETLPDGSMEVVLVGERHGLPYVDAVPIEGRPGFDRDRATALKIEEVIAGPAPPPIAGTTSSAPAVKKSGTDFGMSVEAGGMATIGDRGLGPRGGFFATLGPNLQTRRWRFELRAGVQLTTNRQISSPTRTLELSEVAGLVALRALRHFGRIELGPALSTKLRILDAEGTVGGVSGSDQAFLPALTAGADLRLPLSEMVSFRLFTGVGVNLEHRHLKLDDTPLVDLGVWSGEVQISLLLAPF